MKHWFTLFLVGFNAVASAADFDYHLAAQRVAENVYAFVGRNEDFTTRNGGNIVNTGFIVAPDGVVVIDSGPSLRYGQQMRQAIAALNAKPLALLINTHHHPDHFLGNQAFAGTPIAALPATIEGIASEGNAFAENLFRMTGDWMKGTEVLAPARALTAGVVEVAGRRLRLIALDGHTGADLAIYDETSGVLFAGDLVFNGRAPTTPHADITHWLAALERLETEHVRGRVGAVRSYRKLADVCAYVDDGIEPERSEHRLVLYSRKDPSAHGGAVARRTGDVEQLARSAQVLPDGVGETHGCHSRNLASSSSPYFWLFSGWNCKPTILSRATAATIPPPWSVIAAI